MSDDCLAIHYHDQHEPVPIGPNVYFYPKFDGDSSYINCGSDASLDNIFTGKAATVDCWAKATAPPLGRWGPVCTKYAVVETGWVFEFMTTAGGVNYLDSFLGVSVSSAQSRVAHVPGAWHHYTLIYDDTGDRKFYWAIDGVWAAVYFSQFAGNGIVKDDSALNLQMGRDGIIDWLDGGIQWLRLSNNIRWPVGVDFTPPAMCAPPAVDANTIELWAMDEGSGATTAAEVNSPANDGTLTDCIWHRCT